MISGSSAFDVAACPARAVLPQAHVTGAYAERGTVLHTYARKLALYPLRRAEWLAEVPEEFRHTAAGMNVELALDGIHVIGHERSYALNVNTRSCRFLGTNMERDYERDGPIDFWEIPFSIDVEGTIDGVPVEVDFKTGQSVGDPSEHGQRRIHTAGLMLYYDAPEAIGRLAYVHDNGDITPDGAEFSIMDAWQVCEELKRMKLAVKAVQEVVARGEIPTVYPDRDKQCKYCNSFVYCPYWTNLARSILSVGNDIKLRLEAMSPQELAQALDIVKNGARVMEYLEDQLKLHVYRQPLPLDDKYEFRAETKTGRSYFDASAARGLIVTLLGKLGESDEEIQERIASLTKPGAPYPEIRKRKRLQMVKQ